jgi:hypothetical protein
LVDLKTLLVAIAVTRGQTLPTPKETDGEEDKRRPPPQLLAFVPFTKDELNTAAVRCCSDTDALLATAIANQPTSFQSCSCSCSFFLFVEKPRAVRRPLAFVKNARVVARKREQQQRQQQRQKQRELQNATGSFALSARADTEYFVFSTTAKCNGTREAAPLPRRVFFSRAARYCVFFPQAAKNECTPRRYWVALS